MTRKTKYIFTDEDMDFLKEYYPKRDWDKIKERFPAISKGNIYQIASENNISCDVYFWTEEDKNILINNYNKIPTEDIQRMLSRSYKIRTIQNQAKKLGLTTINHWTQEEIQVLYDYYEILEVPDIMKMLPNRTANAISKKASQLGLLAKIKIDQCFTEDDVKFIVDNWETMTDKQIAEALNRTEHSICDKRHFMGLRHKKLPTSYYTLTEYVRKHNTKWKNKAMENCNYKCVLTGEDTFEIHHLYNFNLILRDVLNMFNYNDDAIIYMNESELNAFIEEFYKEQSKYPDGVCIAPEVHRLFHSIYGNRLNTPEQWDEFKNDFLNGKYNEQLTA